MLFSWRQLPSIDEWTCSTSVYFSACIFIFTIYCICLYALRKAIYAPYKLQLQNWRKKNTSELEDIWNLRRVIWFLKPFHELVDFRSLRCVGGVLKQTPS